jgi:hypothetical protein
MVIAILNGALRVMYYQKYMPEIRAHQFSCFTGIFFFGLAVYGLHIIWPIESVNQALLIGFIWLGLTIVFEFGFGHYIMKHSWEKLLHDYRIDQGRLWSLVLLWILLSPMVIFYLDH